MAFACIPDKPVEQVPIGHITNGIHLLGWMKGTVRRFWRRKLTGDPRVRHPARPRDLGDPNWDRANQLAGILAARWPIPDFISDEELWALRYKLRRELIEFARRRLLIQRQRLTHGDFIAFDQLLNPDALTIGFAPALRHLQTRAADLSAVRKHRAARRATRPGRSNSFSPARRIRATTTASATSSTSFT